MLSIDQIKLLSNLELLIALCCREDDEYLYQEFVNRFYEDLHAECLRIAGYRKLNKHVATQITHETFEKVRKYKSFKVDEVKIPDSKTGILAFLVRISINLFNDHHNSEKRKAELTNHKSYFDNLYGGSKEETDPAQLLHIKNRTIQIFNTLSEKERTVVLTDLEYKKFRKHLYLPDEVNEELANKLGVKKDTVRKIRERAINKIKNAFDGFNKK